MPDVRIIVLTVDGHPTFQVSGAVPVRPAFIEETVKSLYGKQPDGAKHEWQVLEIPGPGPAAAAAVALPASVKK
jgi:hypothetical protein